MTHEPQLPAGLPDLPDLPDLSETPELAALLAAARRTAAVGSGAGDGDLGEERARAAFRAARDAGAYAAAPPWWRRRARDSWWPAAVRRRARSAGLMLGGFALTAALGGVAVAAGSGVLPVPFGGGADEPDSVRPAYSAPAVPGRHGRTGSTGIPEGATVTPDAVNSTGSQSTARRDRALCEAYRKVTGRGKATDATAFEELKAAGGESAVLAYCDGRLGQPGPGRTKNSRADTGGEKDEEKVKNEEKVKEKAPGSVGPAPVITQGSGGGNGNGGRTGNGNPGRGGPATD